MLADRPVHQKRELQVLVHLIGAYGLFWCNIIPLLIRDVAVWCVGMAIALSKPGINTRILP